jgi:hypothetical protein
MKNLSDHTDLPWVANLTADKGDTANWVGWWDWLSMPYGPIPCILYTYCHSQFPKCKLHSNLPYDLFMGMLVKFWFYYRTLFKIVPMFTELHG